MKIFVLLAKLVQFLHVILFNFYYMLKFNVSLTPADASWNSENSKKCNILLCEALLNFGPGVLYTLNEGHTNQVLEFVQNSHRTIQAKPTIASWRLKRVPRGGSNVLPRKWRSKITEPEPHKKYKI